MWFLKKDNIKTRITLNLELITYFKWISIKKLWYKRNCTVLGFSKKTQYVFDYSILNMEQNFMDVSTMIIR